MGGSWALRAMRILVFAAMGDSTHGPGVPSEVDLAQMHHVYV